MGEIKALKNSLALSLKLKESGQIYQEHLELIDKTLDKMLLVKV